MKPGDILLIKCKYCPISWLIRKLIKSNWNHCALVLYNNYILDYRGRKIEINPITRYLGKKKYKLKLIRLEGISKLEINDLMLWMIYYSYNCKGGYLKFLLTTFLLAIGYKGKLPRRTCSGLIAKMFEHIGYYIKLGIDSSKITPEDINSNPNFKEVKL